MLIHARAYNIIFPTRRTSSVHTNFALIDRDDFLRPFSEVLAKFNRVIFALTVSCAFEVPTHAVPRVIVPAVLGAVPEEVRHTLPDDISF